MAKYYGSVGFATLLETVPGVWEEKIVERKYYGDILENYNRVQNSEHLNDDVVFNNRISILSDPYAKENFQMIRYATFMGAKWKVTSVSVAYPRLILNFGGPYNEQTT